MEENPTDPLADQPLEQTPEQTPEQPIIVPGTEREIESLRQYQMRHWWWVCLAVWLSVGAFSLWSLRSDILQLREHFTWVAVRYSLVYNRPAAIGLGLSVGLTIALLWAESRHILLGLSIGEQHQLASRLAKIQGQGPSHPQWKIIQPDRATLEK